MPADKPQQQAQTRKSYTEESQGIFRKEELNGRSGTTDQSIDDFAEPANRGEFLESLGRGRAFEIIADLRAYPTAGELSIPVSGSSGRTCCCWMSRLIWNLPVN